MPGWGIYILDITSPLLPSCNTFKSELQKKPDADKQQPCQEQENKLKSFLNVSNSYELSRVCCIHQYNTLNELQKRPKK
jgi:hypothetical protein